MIPVGAIFLRRGRAMSEVPKIEEVVERVEPGRRDRAAQDPLRDDDLRDAGRGVVRNGQPRSRDGQARPSCMPFWTSERWDPSFIRSFRSISAIPTTLSMCRSERSRDSRTNISSAQRSMPFRRQDILRLERFGFQYERREHLFVQRDVSRFVDGNAVLPDQHGLRQFESASHLQHLELDCSTTPSTTIRQATITPSIR